MTHFEQMELLGQTTIFDFSLAIGDAVKVTFYADELPVVESLCPRLLGVGRIVGRKLGFYAVQFGDSTVEIEGTKLKAVN